MTELMKDELMDIDGGRRRSSRSRRSRSARGRYSSRKPPASTTPDGASSRAAFKRQAAGVVKGFDWATRVITIYTMGR